MANDKLRRQILRESARLMVRQHENEYHRARLRAARSICRGWINPVDLPSFQEIRLEVLRYTQQLDDGGSIAPAGAANGDDADRFAVFRSLLLPLENVQQRKQSHPEGDALYHSLQVFVLAREEIPYDEEFLLAALLHDVGKGVDARNHAAIALQMLAGWITERTAWLIENHQQAHALLEGSLGVRARRRLQQSADYDELLLLARCDRDGRRRGAEVPEIDEALLYLRDLDTLYD